MYGEYKNSFWREDDLTLDTGPASPSPWPSTGQSLNPWILGRWESSYCGVVESWSSGVVESWECVCVFHSHTVTWWNVGLWSKPQPYNCMHAQMYSCFSMNKKEKEKENAQWVCDNNFSPVIERVPCAFCLVPYALCHAPCAMRRVSVVGLSKMAFAVWVCMWIEATNIHEDMGTITTREMQGKCRTYSIDTPCQTNWYPTRKRASRWRSDFLHEIESKSKEEKHYYPIASALQEPKCPLQEAALYRKHDAIRIVVFAIFKIHIMCALVQCVSFVFVEACIHKAEQILQPWSLTIFSDVSIATVNGQPLGIREL